MKNCGKCKKIKPEDDFYDCASTVDGKEGQCKKCRCKGSQKAYRKRGGKTYSSNRHLKQRYGLTLRDYELKLAKQDYRCAICNKHSDEFVQRMHVDHCHSTGKVRDILCVNCNQALGHVQENLTIAKNLMDYIKKYKEEEN